MLDVVPSRRHPRRLGSLILAVLIVTTACGSPAPTPSSSSAAASIAAPSAAAASASASPITSASATPSATASPSPSPSGTPVAELVKGMLAVTVVDGVRVRSQPRVADTSRKYQPVLPSGTSLLVAGGPVVASGYTWIEVSVLSATLEGGVDTGWVAVADHDGTPWVALDPSATGFELASSSAAQATDSLPAARVEAAQSNAFGIALYRKLLASDQQSVAKGMVFSPTSIVSALAMARAGAKGTTATQMDAVLHASGWGQLSLGIASLDQELAARGGSYTAGDENEVRVLSLHAANTAFVQRGFPIESAYLSKLGTTFGAGVALVDFAADTQGAIDAINGWVKAQTVGKIPVIVDQGTITSGTRLALANAVYLKANWAQEFAPGSTANRAFTLFNGTVATVPTMRLLGEQNVGLATGAGWKATELYYAGPSGRPLEMTLILPDNLRTFERAMTAASLTTIQSRIAAAERSIGKVTDGGADECGTYPYQVQLDLPRFGIDTTAGLAKLLGEMGMSAAVTAGEADFSGINPDAGLFISSVIHKATIDVDEKGTTAAAATVIGFDTTGGCGGPQPATTISLKFNHPFLFLIRDVKTGSILFIGRVTDPTQR